VVVFLVLFGLRDFGGIFESVTRLGEEIFSFFRKRDKVGDINNVPDTKAVADRNK